MDIKKRAEKYLKENEILLKKYKIGCSPVVFFPTRNKMPLLAKVGMWLIRKTGGILDMRFHDINKN